MLALMAAVLIAASHVAPVPRLVILDVATQGQVTAADARAAAEALAAGAQNVDAGLVRVVQREQTDGSVPPCSQLACARQRCRAAGSDLAVMPVLTRHDGELQISLTLVDEGTEGPVKATLNSVPESWGAAALQIDALLADVLPRTTRVQRSPAETKRTSVSSDSSNSQPTAEGPVPLARPETERWWTPDHLRRQRRRARSQQNPPWLRPGSPCVLLEADGEKMWVHAKDRARYEAYRDDTYQPKGPSAWAAQYDTELPIANVLWGAPPLMVLTALVFRESEAAAAIGVLGAIGLPMALVAAMVDAADVGKVERCTP